MTARATSPERKTARSSARNPALWVAIAVLAGSSVLMSGAIGYFKIYLKKLPIEAPAGRQVNAIPTASESFVRMGGDQRMGKEIEEVLGTQNYVSRVYREKSTAPGKDPRFLQVHLAYYTGMIDTVPHVPDRCMVGAGMERKGEIRDLPIPFDTSRWTPDDGVPAYLRGKIFRAKTSYNLTGTNQEVVYTDLPATPFRLPRDPQNIRLRTMEFEDPKGNKRFAGYFFIANGGAVSRAEEVRLLAFDLRSTYAYYLKVEFQSEQVSSGEELAALAGKFLDENFAEIMRCTPDWVEVEAGDYPPDNPLHQSAPPAGGSGSVQNRTPREREPIQPDKK